MAVNQRDVKLILLREINVQKGVLFTRQMGAVAQRRKDAWERISEMAWRFGYTNTMRSGKDFRNNNYRVWEDNFTVCGSLYVHILTDW